MCYNGFRNWTTSNTEKERRDLGYRGSTHQVYAFYPIRSDYSLERLVELYVFEIVRLHWVPLLIFYRDQRLTSRFWNKLHEALGAKLKFSTIFHPQTDN